MTENIYNPRKLTAELMAANLPIAGVSSTGQIDYARDLTASEKRTAESIVTAHDPSPITKDARLEAYRSAGITDEDLIFALWDQVIKADNTKVAVLQNAMEAIDSKIN